MSGAGRTPRKAVTRADLCEAVYRKVGLSRSESAAKLSSFGSFVVRSKGPRTGRNPKTGIEVSIAPRQVVVFKASDTLRKRLATVEETTE
jgi:integration host factor subunit alpha